MKITRIETVVVGNPWKNWLFVLLETDEGLLGLGEATSGLETAPVEAQLQELSRFVIGEDPLEPERLWQRIYKGLFLRTTPAMSGIEIACRDIVGKSLCVPLWRLLGGRQRPRLRVYANGWYRGPRDPGFFAEAAAEVKEMGYTALKFDPLAAGQAGASSKRTSFCSTSRSCTGGSSPSRNRSSLNRAPSRTTPR